MQHNSRLDAYLQRGSRVATMAAVVVGVFAFFYTVRPIYEKERLTEEVAIKSFELKKLEDRIVAEAGALAKAQEDGRFARSELDVVQQELSQKRSQLEGLEQAIEALKRNVSLLESDKARALSNTESALFAIYLDQVVWHLLVSVHSSLSRDTYSLLESDLQRVVREVPLSAYFLLMGAIDRSSLKWFDDNVGRGIISRNDVANFSKRLRDAVADAKVTLQRQRFDVKVLARQYVSAVEAEKRDRESSSITGRGVDPSTRGYSASFTYAELIERGQQKNVDAAIAFVKALKPKLDR